MIRSVSSQLLLVVFAVGMAGAAQAEGRPSHFEGKPSDTLAEAVANFSTYNRKLDTLLAKDELTPEDLATIHQLTYTLENALGKINDELDQLTETLEEVHVASERADAQTVLEKGREYVSVSRTVVE